MPLLSGFAALSAAQKFRKLLPFIAVAVSIALFLTLAYCQGKSAGRQAEQVEQLEDDIETLEDLGAANEGAAGDRVADAENLAEQAEELAEALALPGDSRAERRTRSLCTKARQQGMNPLPEVCAALD